MLRADSRARPPPHETISQVAHRVCKGTIELRDGLRFSDELGVTAADCVTSMRRCGLCTAAAKHMFARVAGMPLNDRNPKGQELLWPGRTVRRHRRLDHGLEALGVLDGLSRFRAAERRA